MTFGEIIWDMQWKMWRNNARPHIENTQIQEITTWSWQLLPILILPQSFCPDHRPPPVLKPKGIHRKEKGGRNTTKCVMCLEEVVMIRNKDVIQAPCCGHCSWFHRLCVQIAVPDRCCKTTEIPPWLKIAVPDQCCKITEIPSWLKIAVPDQCCKITEIPSWLKIAVPDFCKTTKIPSWLKIAVSD
uniref:Uncharacterized protein n=1 Tax=Timema genevievae TaxID=629358 RepID=A0A7R9JNY7_TIMGE|nr:unnamed protein product [Timema genevievae]